MSESKSTLIDASAKIYPDVRIGSGTSVGEFSVIGKPYRPAEGKKDVSVGLTALGDRCSIGTHVTIGRGTFVGDGCIIEDGSRIETDVRIGKGCHILYGSQICNEAEINDSCIVGGFVCERAVIGTGSRVFGKLIHKQLDPTSAWDDTLEPSPVLEGTVFIGFDALVIGPVNIKGPAFVCAGAIVTRDVPGFSIAYGVNRISHFKKWSGGLADSPFFHGASDG